MIFSTAVHLLSAQQVKDSILINQDSIKATSITEDKSDIEYTIQYSANDSIYFDVATQTVYLYGGIDNKSKGLAHVDYGDISIDAAYIEINWLTNIITAKGTNNTPDSSYLGAPVFKDGDELFEMDSMKFNTDKNRAIVSGPYTQKSINEHLKANQLYKDENDNLYLDKGQFCPCEDPNASTYIKANKIKVIPNKRVITGPFQLWIADLPTPVFLPFGLFPISQKKTSGVLIPSYGESVNRGFFLKNGGYYWAINDYMDLSLLGEVYTKGGWGLNSIYKYKNRYKFVGDVNLRYNKRVSNSDEIANKSVVNDFWVNWNHKPRSVSGRRFSANINGGTSTYNSNNAYSANNYLSSQFNSAITYYQPIKNTPFSLSVNARHNQNVVTNVFEFTLPEVNVSMNRVYPFKKFAERKSILQDFYKTFSFSYRNDFRNEITNAPVVTSFPFQIASVDTSVYDTLGLDFMDKENISRLLDRAQFGMKHVVPISASFSLGSYKINPSFNYTEFWYNKNFDYTYSDADSAVGVNSNLGFSRAASWNTGASLTTRYYLTSYLVGKRKLQVRHTIIPRVSFTYRPDFSDSRYGYYQKDLVVDEEGTTRDVSRYQGMLFGSPGSGKSSSLGFSLSDVIEMRQTKEDSTRKKIQKTRLIDNIGASGSYNLAAEQFNLSNIAVNARTKLIKNLIDVNFVTSINPYVFTKDTAGNDVEQNIFAWQAKDKLAGQMVNTKGIGSLENVRLSLGTNLSPKTFKKKTDNSEDEDDDDDDALGTKSLDSLSQDDKDHIERYKDAYWDFSIPWSLSIRYNLSRTKIGFADPTINQSITFNGTVNLTEKWRVGFNSGFDLINKEITYTSVNIVRDLNCWEMSLNWVPFGVRQSYVFNLYIKSDLLKQLKLSRRRDWYDR